MPRKLALVAAALLAVAGCGSSTQTVTAPPPARCGLDVRTATSAFSPAGGNGTLSVTANRECTWSAKSEAPWLTLSGPAEGQGDGTLPFAVAANAEPANRTAAINVNDERLSVTQQGRPCEFQVSPTLEQVGAEGGERTLDVRPSSAQCEWSARAEDPWIAITAGGRGTGNGTVTFRVEPLAGQSRTGTLVVAGARVQVEQSVGCSYAVGATTVSAPALGGLVSVPVSAPSGCAWTAESQVSWISVASGATGSGPGVVGLQVAGTAGPPRTGLVTIAGRSVTVEQSPGCGVAVNPPAVNVGSGGGTSSFKVQIASSCAWSAMSTVEWIALSATTGVGTSEVQFSVASSIGPGRTGSIRVNDQTISVTQASGCTVSTDPAGVTAPAAGVTSTLQIGSGPGCTWSASSSAPWISIVGTTSGTGAGQLQLAIASNTGPARQGAIAIGGRTVGVTQASGCVYDVAPRQIDAPGLGGAASVTVATGPACPWSAASGSDWITFAPPSGTGPAQVHVNVGANPGPARTGSAVVAGSTITVAQSSPCTFVLLPPFLTYDASGGNGAVLVIVTGGCTWAAASGSEWITMVGPTSGRGDGVVQFTVAPNSGAARTGTVVIAGLNYPVTQSGR